MMNLSELTDEINKISLELITSLRSEVVNSNRIILIGNGGSNSIASHIAIDYQKFLNIKTTSLTDTGMLSMLVNDYGSEQSYSKFIEMNYEENMLVILISSSGNSTNVLNALHTANQLHCRIISLSGFDKNNKLYTVSSTLQNVILNYHVNSMHYGIVETTHQVFLHSIV